MRDKIFALSIDRDTGHLHVTDADIACNRVALGWHIIMQGSEKDVMKRAQIFRNNPQRASKYLTL